MYPKFLNRREELEFLNKKFKENGFQFIVFYGRRRIGKSELLTYFCRSKPHLYFLANKRGTEKNADRFIEIASNTFNDFKPVIRNFEDCFKYVLKKTKNERFIVCMDEFSYLVEKDPDVTSEFQIIADRILKNSNIILILCGSSISMMEKGVLSYKSPLYGRRTAQWQLNPFNTKELFEYFHNIDFLEFIKIFAVFGNIPAYFLLYDKNKDLLSNIKNKILTKGEFLYKEGEILLREELKEPDTYFDILKAMSNVAKPSKIANLASVNEKDLPKYIKNLESLDLVERINPITAKKNKTKTTLYFIKDNFLNSWFRFVYPNFSQLEERRIDEAIELIKNNLDGFIEKIFERFCQKIIEERLVFENFTFTHIGKQWGKFVGERGKNTYEIDIVALNGKNKQILLCECKWQETVDANEILDDLKQKAKYVNWYNEEREEYYAIFAKSFKEKVSGKNVFLLDLKSIEKAISKN